MADDLSARLSDALRGAIGSQAQSYLARIVGVYSNGTVQAFSEALGTVQVLARTVDDLKAGDNIYIRKSKAEGNAPYIYAGFASNNGGQSTQPGLSPKVPIKVPDANDTTPQGSIGTLQYRIDKIVRQIQAITGEATWQEA